MITAQNPDPLASALTFDARVRRRADVIRIIADAHKADGMSETANVLHTAADLLEIGGRIVSAADSLFATLNREGHFPAASGNCQICEALKTYAETKKAAEDSARKAGNE